MGKRTYNNGSHVLNQPPLKPFYIEKESDYHPNLRHYPDYRRYQYDSVKREFVPKIFHPNPVKSTYQDDYDVKKNEAEQFKDFETAESAKCVKLQNKRDIDVLLAKEKKAKANNHASELKDTELLNDKFDCDNFENPPKYFFSETSESMKKEVKGPRFITKVSKRPAPKKPFPNLSIYDTTYNRMAKVNDLPALEKKIRDNQSKRNINTTKNNKENEYLKFLNEKNNIYTCESSHFHNIIDESQVFHPYPNFPAPSTVYSLLHTTKGDFNTSYNVLHDNRKFSVPEPDIYRIKKQIFDEEKEVIKDILKKNNDDIKGNVNVNIYNP